MVVGLLEDKGELEHYFVCFSIPICFLDVLDIIKRCTMMRQLLSRRVQLPLLILVSGVSLNRYLFHWENS